jgi:hypothetical protein
MVAKLHITTHPDGSATIISNSGEHGPHNESNPDDGSISPFALDLAAQMEKLGFETVVSRME